MSLFSSVFCDLRFDIAFFDTLSLLLLVLTLVFWVVVDFAVNKTCGLAFWFYFYCIYFLNMGFYFNFLWDVFYFYSKSYVLDILVVYYYNKRLQSKKKALEHV